jgi:hypothetical protein
VSVWLSFFFFLHGPLCSGPILSPFVLFSSTDHTCTLPL